MSRYAGLRDVDIDLLEKNVSKDTHEKRVKQVENLIKDFIKFYKEETGMNVVPIDELSRKLTMLYFAMLVSHVKPSVGEKINKYKMASLMELLIVQNQVLRHVDPNAGERKNRQLNAAFGMNAALSLIGEMIQDAGKKAYFSTLNASVDERGEQLMQNHLVWLETKHLHDMPIIINAQFYEVLEVLRTSPFEIHGHRN